MSLAAAAAAAPAAAPPAAAPQVDAEALRRAEDDLRTKEADLRIMEADLRDEKRRLETKEARRDQKDAELATAKKAKPGRLGRAPTSATLDQAIAEAKGALVAAQADVDAAKQAVTAQQAVVNAQVNAVRYQEAVVSSLRNQTAVPIRVLAREWFSRELPRHTRPDSNRNSRTKLSAQSETVRVPQFAPWPEFEQGLAEFLASEPMARQIIEPLEQVVDLIFDLETKFEGAFGPARSATFQALNQLFAHLSFTFPPLGIPGNVYGSSGGICDECTLYDGVLRSIGEWKAPLVFFDTDRQPHEVASAMAANARAPNRMKGRSENTFFTLLQLFTYLVGKSPRDKLKRATGGLRHGYISNYDSWVFVMRSHDAEGNEVLLCSPYYDRTQARAAWAYFKFHVLSQAPQLLAVGKSGERVIHVDATGNAASDDDDDQGPSATGGGGGGAAASGSSAAAGGAAARGGRRRPLFTEFPEQSPSEVLGVDSLLTLPDAVELSVSDKSATYRGTIGGRDLAWRQVDRHGLPKHTEWTLDGIVDATETEVRAYCQLREAWGRVVPHLVLRGRDFNQFWVTVTSYEGVSLQRLADEGHGLFAAVKSAALASLDELHRLGVIHGDMELRNAVRREKDGAVLWVDLEFARFKADCAVQADFDKLAEEEMRALRELLDDVATLPDAPARRRSPPCKQSRIVPCC